MSWHFSQALAAAYSGANCSDGEPSAPWNGTPFAQDDSCSAKMKDICHRSPFGMMYLPLTDSLGADVLTWFREVFPAKTSAQPDQTTELVANSLDSMDRKADCGGTCHEWFAKLSLDSLSWKTAQCSLFADLEPCSVTWPRWGLMLDGECSIALDSERITSANGSSSLLPTPTAHNAKEGAYPAEFTRNTPTLAAQIGGKINPTWNEWRMGWPLKWTDLKPLETDKFRQWLSLHGKH